MQAHVSATHPECKFCHTRFFDSDALFHHMRMEHMLCHVCESSGTPHRHFATPADLLAHVSEDHYPCQEPICREGLVAFATTEQLEAHRISEHTNRMTRLDRSRARQLQIEPAFMQAYAQHQIRQEVHQSRGGARRRGGGVASPPLPHIPMRRGGADEGVLNHSGLTLVDDAEGTVVGGQVQGGAGDWPGLGVSSSRGQGDWVGRGRAPQERGREAFPTLEAAVGYKGVEEGGGRTKLAPLVRKQAVCGCGVLKQAVVVEEGKEPPVLKCGAKCAAEARRRQLADAFGAEEGAEAAFVTKREVEWSSELVIVRSPLSLIPNFLSFLQFDVDSGEENGRRYQFGLTVMGCLCMARYLALYLCVKHGACQPYRELCVLPFGFDVTRASSSFSMTAIWRLAINVI
jgi:hypothetical protein